jgi:hypothetical protein
MEANGGFWVELGRTIALCRATPGGLSRLIPGHLHDANEEHANVSHHALALPIYLSRSTMSRALAGTSAIPSDFGAALSVRPRYHL